MSCFPSEKKKVFLPVFSHVVIPFHVKHSKAKKKKKVSGEEEFLPTSYGVFF